MPGIGQLRQYQGDNQRSCGEPQSKPTTLSTMLTLVSWRLFLYGADCGLQRIWNKSSGYGIDLEQQILVIIA